MAKKIRKRQQRQTKKAKVSPFNIYWEKKNYYLLAIGFLLLIIGFYFLSVPPWNSSSSLSIAPVVLIIAYVIIFPAAIFYRAKIKNNLPEEKEIDTGKS